ncbi:hypothetical protein LCGC14_2141320 [marine sediment metagenome]|uniref:Uncharacterized protein n=1 Tax=marine sediment metagenome TaxID=412755 RepID=A0A0F9GUN0_9ZZZZ
MWSKLETFCCQCGKEYKVAEEDVVEGIIKSPHTNIISLKTHPLGYEECVTQYGKTDKVPSV